MTAVQNAFKINGTLLSHQPTEHGWKDRQRLGTDGNGREIYAAPREYELQFDFMSPAEFNQLHGFYLLVGNTGSVVFEAPQYPPIGVYQFRAYSGTVLSEPTYSNFFENFYSDVRLVVSKITT